MLKILPISLKKPTTIQPINVRITHNKENRKWLKNIPKAIHTINIKIFIIYLPPISLCYLNRVI